MFNLGTNIKDNLKETRCFQIVFFNFLNSCGISG